MWYAKHCLCGLLSTVRVVVQGGGVAEDVAAVAGVFSGYNFSGPVARSKDESPNLTWTYGISADQTEAAAITCSAAVIYDFHVSDTCGNTLTVRGGFHIVEGFGPVITSEARDMEVRCTV